MFKFIVIGTFCEYMCVLHCLAEDHVQAREKYEQAFTKEQKAGMYVGVSSCEECPHITDLWDYDGMTSYFGGYEYNY